MGQLIAHHDVAHGNRDDKEYNDWIDAIGARVNAAQLEGPIFRMRPRLDLFELYLASFEGADRQFHNCNACKHFINRYGWLVKIEPDGRLTSLMWDTEMAPASYKQAAFAMGIAVIQSQVEAPFVSPLKDWGYRRTGDWSHFAVTNARVYTDRIKAAHEWMAEKREEYGMVTRALADFKPEVLAQAQQLLEGDLLYRAEKVIGPVRWLRQVAQRMEAAGARLDKNVLWREVATAPAGFCHIRSGMAGTLLEDLAAGMPFDTVRQRFDKKMKPDVYMRPQTDPGAQNIKRGEEIVAKLGIENSLKRRFATLDDITDYLWVRPATAPSASTPAVGGGVFAHLKARGTKPTTPVGGKDTPPITMTGDKFVRTVLPNAKYIEYFVPGSGGFVALVTAEDPSAPPILQWDRPERRNPVSHYLYMHGSPAMQWGLVAGSWHPVSVVTTPPATWHGASAERFGNGLVLILEGAADSRTDQGLALFPETLRGELHEIRKTIEAFSKAGSISRVDDPAAGVMFNGKDWVDALVRVKTDLGIQTYKLDRRD